MQFLKHIAILILLCCYVPLINAQSVRYSFQNFTDKEGLSDNNIHSFYQDTRGYLWMGTNEGLNRFDGFIFKKFYSNNRKNSLPSNIVNYVLEHKPGFLLISTSNGLTIFNSLTNSFEPVADTIVATKSANHIHKDRNGNIILSYADGIAFLDSAYRIKEFIKTSFSLYWAVIKVHELRSGELLAATSKGYFFIDKARKSLRPLDVDFKNANFPHYLIFSSYDSISNLIFTSEWNNGLFIIDLDQKKIERYNATPGCKNCLSTNMVFCAFADSQQKIWVGSDSGIFLLNRRTGKTNIIQHQQGEANSLLHNKTLKIYEDENKTLWFATSAGLSKLNPKAQSIREYKNEFLLKGKPATINYIIRGNDNRLYISTYGNGIFAFDEETKVIENIGKTLMPFNWSVTKSGDSIIATGHDKRIYSYHPGTKKVLPHNFLSPFYGKSNLLLFSFHHSSGDKWYSLNEGGGLVLYNNKEKKYFHYTNKDTPQPFSENYFSVAEEDEERNIWFAVNRSTQLVCWIYKTRQFKTIDFKKVPGNNNNNFAGITDILVNGNEIWAATAGTGIVVYRPATNSIKTFSINDGLAGDVVNSLFIDNKKRVWAGTAKGLSCRLPGQKYFSSFAEADGLPETNFNERTHYYDPVKNQLYLGANNSLLIFNPDELLHNKEIRIRAHLDGIKVNGKNLVYQENANIKLDYDQNNLQFNFSVVDLNSSSGINLLYRLTGADNDWINAEGQRTATYINLPAGQYILNLKILKSGMDFSAYSLPFSFTIKQAWWKSTWFFLSIVLAGILVLYIFIRRYYRGKLEHQQMIFEKKQAIEKERSRIATDMHDDLGAGLTGIKFLTENIAEHNISTNTKERLEKLKVSANKLIESMGEIIWAMNEKNNTLEDLLFHLRSYSITYCEENNLACVFNLPDNITEKIINGHHRRNIYLIVKECLHNIVKHGKAKKVNFNLIIKKDLYLTIHDDGKGFNAIESSMGNGLINMEKRAKEMNGSINIVNNNGTMVMLKIPLL